MRLAGVFSLALAAAAQVLTLQDGTPVRLRLNRTVSSANAHVGETVDFEVTEPVINQNYVVISKGAVVLGRVTKVETKGPRKNNFTLAAPRRWLRSYFCVV